MTVSHLQLIFDRIIDKLSLYEGKEGNLPIRTLSYRLIPTENWSDFEDPANWFSANSIDIGDMQDDMEALVKLSENPDRPCTFVDFDRAASLLRELSQVYNPV